MSWAKVGNLRPAQYAAIVQSTAAGVFSGTFPVGRFSAAPVILAQPVMAGGRDYVVTITNVTAAAFAGQVRMSQKLPAVIGALTLLQGFDPFTAPGVAVSVNIHAIVAG